MKLARLGIFLLSGGSIAALLADIYGLAPMHQVFWIASVPSMALLVCLTLFPRVPEELRNGIKTGAIGGLVGTLGYDIVRVPFALAGQRVFAPIESYGILIADASTSSGLTSTLGWLYHLSNGVTFGIAYAAIAARRHWLWAVAWALVLESVAVFSPFAVRYGIAGQLVPIAIAYGAHIAYGAPLGLIVQKGWRPARYVTTVSLIVAVLAVLGWHRPWQNVTPSGPPTLIVEKDRFEPEWARVHKGECVTVDNRSGTGFETPFGAVPAKTVSRLCFQKAGTHRIKLGTRPYSGGFVYVEDDRPWRLPWPDA